MFSLFSSLPLNISLLKEGKGISIDEKEQCKRLQFQLLCGFHWLVLVQVAYVPECILARLALLQEGVYKTKFL